MVPVIAGIQRQGPGEVALGIVHIAEGEVAKAQVIADGVVLRVQADERVQKLAR